MLYGNHGLDFDPTWTGESGELHNAETKHYNNNNNNRTTGRKLVGDLGELRADGNGEARINKINKRISLVSTATHPKVGWQ